MTNGFVRTATYADVPFLASDLRRADIAEIKAFSGNTPEEAISTGIGLGAKVACLPNGIPAAVFGVGPSAEPTLGFVWMVATNQFHKLHRQFLREGREHLDYISRPYGLIMNFTDARNEVHHRWLQWMGFTIIKRHEEFGVEKRPFLEFCRITGGPNV